MPSRSSRLPLLLLCAVVLVVAAGSYQALTGGVVPKSPDLYVPDVTVRVAQKNVTIQAVVVNRGNGRAVANFTGLRIDAGGNGVFEVTPAAQRIGQLGIGQSATVEWSTTGTQNVFTWNAPAGKHVAEVCADAGSGGAKPAVAESNENNNCTKEEFTVR